MKKLVMQGLGTGFIAGCVAWLEELNSGTRVSTFPGILSLVVLVVLTAIVFRKVERAQRARAATVFGLASGGALSAVTNLRGAVRWTTLDVSMLAVSIAASLVLVFVITHVVALLARPRVTNVMSVN